MNNVKHPAATGGKKPGLMSLLRPYRRQVLLLVFLALLSNGLNLVLPALISKGIDAYGNGTLVMKTLLLEFSLAAGFIFIFTYLQSLIQVHISEKVARETRTTLAARISRQDYTYIQKANPSKLLTNLTSDVDNIKLFVSQAIVSIVSSAVMIIGASALLLSIDWKLGLIVICIVPVIGFAFFTVLNKVKVLFKKGREVVDKLNKTINENITGAALVRVLNAQQREYDRFIAPNGESRSLGIAIVRLFASLIPVITFMAGVAVLSTLLLGGHFVIKGEMSIGNIAAFNSYIALLIFPIIVIGFMSNIIAQATTSYGRISEVLNAPEKEDEGTVTKTLDGSVSVQGINMQLGGKPVLKDVSFAVKAGTRTAIIGPTAAGKTQLLNVIVGLQPPDTGTILYDGTDVNEYNRNALLQQVGLVFQDSIVFNMSLRENIAFNEKVSGELMQRAIETAELKEFIATLPDGLETVVSERGASLSGGQKQRIMLARALAINPRVLLLDDFTARVDANTEQRILENVQENYPDITLISVTQKIDAVRHFDQIILLMDGELVASGTHDELMQTCPEYVQIFNSQRSTSNYELQPEQ
ncbi:ABC transporter ATP-binding protein [Chitinophaga tropicalis]|uniref:ATP-binding cassette domain-containing protein n=1 Tax=Chitinophaga tropicalis TaxID=2683588 RepID=A0A7K1UD15_9BACT|nr:ABC transporter ATP-binding protein [Chitinophaga tropicalis]MVT12216.1 ATP-binding cassette domain-containing protein [Chitinophaga tropicalis]